MCNEDRFSSKLLGQFCGRIYCKVKPLNKCQEIGQNVKKIPNSICISHYNSMYSLVLATNSYF